MLESARELNERLRQQGHALGVRLVEPPPSWYGIDPIHVRRSLRHEAWDRILVHPRLPHEGRLEGGGGRLPVFGAAELKLFGVRRRNPQPVCRFKDGTTVALY
jgi:hypothetical protein